LTEKLSVRAAVWRLAQVLIGFLFSGIVLSRGIMPFGVAYAAAGSGWGFLGAFLGHFFSGRDALRILTSCFMSRVFRLTMPSLSDADRPLACFLFTLWGTMLGGLVGFFFSDYTPKENFAFMLNGLLSGGLAWVFCVAASSFSGRPLGHSVLRYVTCLISLSSVLLGLMSYGGLWESAGRTAFLFLILCVGHKCSFFYTFSSAVSVGILLCLFSAGRVYWFLSLFFGLLLSAALRPFGKYGQLVSYLSATLILWFFSGRAFPLTPALISVFFAGMLFLMLPGRLLTRLTRESVPFGGTLRGRWKETRLRFRRTGSTGKTEGEAQVCRRCAKRILCRTRYRTETAEAFDLIRKGVREQDLRPPREFLDRCVRFPEVIAALRTEEETRFGLVFAKAFSRKDGELFCGDTVGSFRTADDRYVFTLADGMGSGTGAARQSVKAVRVMENLSRSGLDQEDILKVLNRNLLAAAEESVLGVDVASVDLKNGRCDLYKAGAAPTYILRSGNVYEIGSETLPVGMLEEAEVKHERCSLAEGDVLILISDGVLGKDKGWLAEYLDRTRVSGDCVALADGILREAKKAGRNQSDDLTVLVVRVCRAEEAA